MGRQSVNPETHSAASTGVTFHPQAVRIRPHQSPSTHACLPPPPYTHTHTPLPTRGLTTHTARPPPPLCPPPCPQSVFVGNGLMAILAGLVASYLVDKLKLGPVAPFDASAAVLLAGGAVITLTWPENYGAPSHRGGAEEGLLGGMKEQFAKAAGAIMGGE